MYISIEVGDSRSLREFSEKAIGRLSACPTKARQEPALAYDASGGRFVQRSPRKNMIHQELIMTTRVPTAKVARATS